MDIKKQALQKHAEWKGKIEMVSRVTINSREDLSLAYTPGVAEPCREIEKDPAMSYKYTRRANSVAVVTDGSAVLGLGNIGALAGMPVMEGKCCLFKEFAGIDAYPVCINSNDPDEIVRTIELISGGFGGINLEDISAPRCFEIERELQKRLDIPVFHDDQHGTAIAVGAGIINSLKITGKKSEDVTAVINGMGAAGTAVANFLISLGIGNIIAVDKAGILSRGFEYENTYHAEIAEKTNKLNRKGTLADAVRQSDIFIGVSKPALLTEEMVKSMNSRAIVFALANPEPEIMPDKAKAAGAFIAATGRSDFPNQINNLLAFPGVFKGALSARASAVTEKMKLAAAVAIADFIPENELGPENIIPPALDKNVTETVAKAVRNAV